MACETELLLREARRAFGQGELERAQMLFGDLLRRWPRCTQARHYALALRLMRRIQLLRMGGRGDVIRVHVAELAAWATHCALDDDGHQALLLRVALCTAAAVRNWSTVARLARRLLDLDSGGALAERAAAVAKLRGAVDLTPWRYDWRQAEHLGLSACPALMMPLYGDRETTQQCERCAQLYCLSYGQTCCVLCGGVDTVKCDELEQCADWAEMLGLCSNT